MGLVTDLSELRTAASCLQRGLTEEATFSLVAPRLPTRRGFLVAAGLADVVQLITHLSFDDADLRWLADRGFDGAALDALAGVRFTGDVWAVREGHVVFADEPLVEVTAPLPEAHAVGSIVQRQITYQTVLATKAARCRLAAAGRGELIDVAPSRTGRVDGGMAPARAAAIAGFAGTSNLDAARRLGLAPVGTRAHSYLQVFSAAADGAGAGQLDRRGSSRSSVLVDGHDSIDGVARALDVAEALCIHGPVGVRLDSPNLLELARQTRALLDRTGRGEIAIVASGGLDELDVQRLLDAGAPIDAFGIGPRAGLSADVRALETAYELVEVGGRPVMGHRPGKQSRPGRKQVHRGQLAAGDVLSTRCEPAPAGHRPLLVEVIFQGAATAEAEPIDVLSARLAADLAALPMEARDLVDPHAPPLHVSPGLDGLTRQVRAAHRRRRAEDRSAPGTAEGAA